MPLDVVVWWNKESVSCGKLILLSINFLVFYKFFDQNSLKYVAFICFMYVKKKLQEVILPWGLGAFGFVFYLTRYPEKLWRKSGFFDIFGASHQVKMLNL